MISELKFRAAQFIQWINPCTRIEGEPDRRVFAIIQILLTGTKQCTCCAFLRGVVIGLLVAALPVWVYLGLGLLLWGS